MSSTRISHITRPVLLAVAGLAALAMVSACTADSDWSGPEDGPRPPIDATLVSELRTADDCDALVDSARSNLESTVDMMWGDIDTSTTMADREIAKMDGASGSEFAEDSAAAESSPAPTAAAADSLSGGDSSGQVVGTNNQEQGVDEGDLVKTDGARIVSVVDGVLRITVLDGSPTIDGTLDLTNRSATELFLRGDEALVIGTSYGMQTMTDVGPATDFGVSSSSGMSEGDSGEASTEPSPPQTFVPETTFPDTTTSTSPPSAPTTIPQTTIPQTTTTIADPMPTPEPMPEPQPYPEPAPFPTTTTVTRVSLADPANPIIIEAADLEGSLVASRMIDGRVRLVVRSEPQVMTDLMYATGQSDAEDAVASMKASDLMPRIVIDGEVSELGSCDDVLLASVAEPAPDYSYAPPMLSTVTVATVGDALSDLQPVSVQGAADTVYASTDALYVGAQTWDGLGSRTDLHRFDLTGDGAATYTGSGAAPGRLLNQFSLSDRDGALRIVTTVDGQAVIDGPSTSARLTILDTDGALDEIGHLDGLGEGEEVQSVRFLDSLAYVVTFRQTDPLYALDLSDPSNPTILGELKIPGFSEYLHPVGNGLLLGVGREVDPTTQRDLGLKVSLFDVSDPAAMVEIDRLVQPDSYSQISSDHKAFTWDPQRNQAVVPVDDSMTGRGYAEVVSVRDGKLAVIGRFAHEANGMQVSPMRSLVVGEDLWSLSYGGLGRSDANVPTSVELLGF